MQRTKLANMLGFFHSAGGRRAQRRRLKASRTAARRHFRPIFESLEARQLLAGVWDGGGAVDDWNDPLNWDDNALPGAGTNVVIGAAEFSGITITSANNVTVNSVSSEASLSITAGTFSVAANSTLNNAFNFSGGVLTGAGNVTIVGVTTWTGGTMSGSSVTTTSGSLAITANNTTNLDGRTLNINGSATLTGAGGTPDWRGQNGAVVNNAGLFEVLSDASIAHIPTPGPGDPSIFNNLATGTFLKSGGTGVTNVSFVFNNSGAVQVNTGTLSLNAGGTSTGSFTAAATTLVFGGGTHDINAGSTLSAGTVRFSAGTTNFNGGTYNVTGATQSTGGTAANFNAGINVVAVGSALTVSVGTLNFSSGEPISAATLTLNGGELSGSDSVTISGATTWTSGNMFGSGQTTTSGSLAITASNQRISGRTLNINGGATLTGGGAWEGFNGAVVNNNAGQGVAFDVQSDADLGGGSGDATFNNNGTFRKSVGTDVTVNNFVFNNSGAVEVNSGTLSHNFGGTSTGSFSVSPAATLAFGGGIHTLNLSAGSSISGAGTVRFSAGTTHLNGGTYNVSGSTQATGSGAVANFNAAVNLVNVGAALTMSSQFGNFNFSSGEAINATTFNMSTGTLSGSDNVTISGASTWTGGIMRGSGQTTTNGSLAITAENSAELNGRTLNMNGGATLTGTSFFRGKNDAVFNNNNGVFDVQTDSRFLHADVEGPTATFNNLANGTFRKSAGAGSTDVDFVFNNSGVVQVNTGTLTLKAGGTSTGDWAIAATRELRFSAASTYLLDDGTDITGAGTAILTANPTVNVGDAAADVVNVANLVIGFNFSSGTLAVVGTLNISGFMTLGAGNVSGTLSGTGDVNIAGLFTWQSGHMAGAGRTFANGGIAFNVLGGSVFLENSRRLDNAGTATWISGGQAIRMSNGAVFNNHGLFDAQDNSSLNNGGGPALPAFNNFGTFRKSGGTGVTNVTVHFNNTGAVDVQVGTANFGQGGTSTGSWAVAAPAILRFGGGTHDLNAGSSVSGAGTVLVSSGTLNSAGTYNVANTQLGGGTADFSVAANTGTLDLGNAANQPGTLQGSADVTISGLFTWFAGTMTGGGKTFANGGITFDIKGGGANLNGRRLDAAGTSTWLDTRDIALLNGAVFNNNGVFEVAHDLDINSAGGAASTFNNNGTFRKSAGTGLTTIGVPFTNNGTIDAQTGTLNLNLGLTNYSAATTTLTGGTYLVAGTFQFTGGNVVTSAATIVLSGTASSFPNINSLATNAAAGNFTIQNSRNFTSLAGLSNAGSVTIGAGSTLATGGTANYTQTAGSTVLVTATSVLDPAGLVEIQAGSLSGFGTVQGNVQNAGQVIPGTSPGITTINGDYSQVVSGALNVEIGGTNPATPDFDQLIVNGTGTLGGALNVSLISGFVPVAGTPFTIINNDLADLVSGTFAGLAEGATITVGSTTFQITYFGGTGNDVVLTAVPRVSIGDVSAAEGNSGVTQFTFTVSIDGIGTSPITVRVDTADGTATVADNDYTAVSNQTVTFSPGGPLTQSVVVSVGGDTKFETDQTFVVNLSNPTNAVVLDGQGQGTIVNDDVRPTIAIAPASASEGAAVALNLTLSNLSDEPVSVLAGTADGSATAADNDYLPLTNQLITFAPGTGTAQVVVQSNQDTKFETDQTFTVVLTGQVNASGVSGSPATGTIVNDDARPTITIAPASANEGAALTFNLTLSNLSDEQVTVLASTADGTATTADNDYAPLVGHLITFAPGASTAQVVVQSNQDTKFEADHAFSVVLSGAVNAGGLSGSPATGTIVNDDLRPTISIITDVSQLEGNAGAFVDLPVSVSLTHASDEVITVRMDTADGAATAVGNDYQAIVNRILTFSPGGLLTQQATVRVLGDDFDEENEAFTASLSNATNATLSFSTATVTILDDDGAPTLSINNVTLSEGNSGQQAFVFTVTLAGTSSQPVTVQVQTQDGTATASDSDYQPLALQTLTFNVGGPATQQVTVQVNGDTKFEADQTFTVALSNATNATISDATGLGTITNDDGRPTISIAAASALEGDAVTFNLSLSNLSDEQVTVVAATADGTATTADSDYSPITNQVVTFAPGANSATVVVQSIEDAILEADEVFTLVLTNPTNATGVSGSPATGTIVNDDQTTTSISIDDVSLSEGNTGDKQFTFTVSLSGPSGQPISVQFQVADGSALVSDNDYQASIGTLNFPANSTTTQTIIVLVHGDTKFETDQTFFVNLQTPTNATIADDQGLGTITNDDSRPSIAISGSPSQAEGSSGAFFDVPFTISLSNASDEVVSVRIDTADGAATAASGDYDAVVNQILTFNPGTSLTQQTLVRINGDNTDEDNETFTVTLSSPVNGTLGTSASTATIIDDDGAPTLTINDVTLTEGNNGTRQFAFIVTLSGTSSQPVTVQVATQDAAATDADNDYEPLATQTLTFDVGGATTQQVIIQVNGDTKFETDQTFTATLSSATNATISDGSGLGTILNDDARPTITIAGASANEGDVLTFNLTLSNSSDELVTVLASTANGTATTADNDYSPVSNQLVSFPGGVTTSQFVVQSTEDTRFEADQTFTVVLSGAVNATGVSGTPANGTIVNDDTRPTISINDRSAAETNGSFFDVQFSISLSHSTDETVTVRVDTADGTATTADNDYVAVVNRTVTFAAGVTTQQTAVRINGDTKFEPDETLFVNLSAAANASSIADNQGLGTITNDDAQPPNNQPPAITSNGSGDTATVSMAENTTAVADVNATDPDLPPQTLTFSIAGGPDAARFVINGTSGLLSFSSAPNFESQADAGGNNVYDVIVRVSDGSLIDTQTIAVTVTNVNEAPTLNSIPNPAAILVNAGPQTINLSGISAATGESQTLTVIATSNNPGLIPDPTVNYASANATGSLSYTPVANQIGTGVITVTVRDDGGTANGGVGAITRTFTITVLADNGPGFDLSVPNRAQIVPDPANPGRKVLLAIGGGAGDALTLEQRPSNRVQIRVKQTGRLLGIFPTSAFGRIVVFGMAGNDTIVIDSRITKAVELHGGLGDDNLLGGSGRDLLFGEGGNDNLSGRDGNDQLNGGDGNDAVFGGKGSDILVGGPGNDKLYGEAGADLLLGGLGEDQIFGGTGRDLLIGGRGADRLSGQEDDDLLIGGETIHDNHDDALKAILAEWNSTHSFATRLKALAPLLNSNSVVDDLVRDEISGNGGRDWILDFALADLIHGFDGKLATGDRRN